MTNANYGAQYGIPISFTFTPGSGSPFGSTQAMVEDFSPPAVDLNEAKFTTISGALAGIEQGVPGSIPMQTLRVKATYVASAHAAAIVCQQAKSIGTLVATYADGSTDTMTAYLKTVTPSSVNATSLRTDDLVFTVRGDIVFAAGTDVPVNGGTGTNSYTFPLVLTANAATIDLTAIPHAGTTVDATGEKVTISISNPLGNDAMTVEAGATNGHTGFGASFSTAIGGGNGASLVSTVNVASDNKTLDVTGTGTETLYVTVSW